MDVGKASNCCAGSAGKRGSWWNLPATNTYCLMLLLALTAPESIARAGDPPSILAMFRKKQPDVSADALQLRAEHGPWLILAVTLSGDDAH